ncbi:hypothetical protein TL16_g05186 [Triparma laevis f. inornata]|uniref:Uncharacterized protein n=2 Tax=Triparma laevis TaxID=1534972 RepID=A0A9W7B0U8_9STRA|nr:hypothetical protein TL16_g05186 [Triparma laevis f. inornata]GMH79042.1 hypothetical protein TrLO_g7734 [Triparma laevis f. longispina]
MAFPETAAEKYVEGNVHSKESKFWTGWFSVSLVQTAIMIFTIHKYVDEADLANACKVSCWFRREDRWQGEKIRFHEDDVLSFDDDIA